MKEASKRRVLLTGAAGRIGRTFRELEGQRYDLRLADINLSAMGDPAGHEVMPLDIVDREACYRACEGIDTVVHLAGDPSGQAGFYESLLDKNIKGVYNIFEAAAAQDCRRVIFASTVQTIDGYDFDSCPTPDMRPRPRNMYAVSKVFGEAVGHAFAHSHGLSSIAIRIGGFEGNSVVTNYTHNVINTNGLSRFISRRDMAHLLVRCIEAPNITFAIVHGLSNNRFKRMDLAATRELLDYHPQDDAFRMFNVPLNYDESWLAAQQPEDENEHA